MQKKAFKLMSLVLGLVISMAIFIGFSNNTVKAYSPVDYTKGDYVDIGRLYLQNSIINMPEGSNSDERKNWETSLIRDLSGWFRVPFVETTEPIMIANFKIDGCDYSLLYNSDYKKVVISYLSVDYEIVEIDNQSYIEFFIPNKVIKFIFNNQYYTFNIPNAIIGNIYNNSLKLINPKPLLNKDETLEGIKLGSIDDLNHKDYLTEQKTSYELANNLFRFEKPANKLISTKDIANVKTSIDNKEYTAILHYTINENGESALMLGRFKVNYNEIEIGNKTYIEFYLPFCEVEYYETQESSVKHTLKISVLDSIKPIDTTFVKLKYDLSKQLNNEIESYKQYAPIFGVLGGGLIVCSTFLFISIYRKRKNK